MQDRVEYLWPYRGSYFCDFLSQLFSLDNLLQMKAANTPIRPNIIWNISVKFMTNRYSLRLRADDGQSGSY